VSNDPFLYAINGFDIENAVKIRIRPKKAKKKKKADLQTMQHTNREISDIKFIRSERLREFWLVSSEFYFVDIITIGKEGKEPVWFEMID